MTPNPGAAGFLRRHDPRPGRPHAGLRHLGVPLRRRNPSRPRECPLRSTPSTYGWLWLIIGIVLILCSFTVLSGSEFARWIGTFAAAFLAISAISWIPYYPGWALVYILLGVLVVYGLNDPGDRPIAF